MDHDDHVRLIRDGISGTGGRWADLGSGAGAFTLALADVLGPDAVIYSVDRDAGALRRQQHMMHSRFPAVTVHYVVADYTRPRDLFTSLESEVLPLDGVIMANALHFQPRHEQVAVLGLVQKYLRPGGRLILIEYNADHGNCWVPYPLSYSSFQSLAASVGFVWTRLLAVRPSRFLGDIYSALTFNPGMLDQPTR